MENIAEIVLRFLSEFSFKKVVSLILLLTIAFVCIMIFDRLTETLSLSRIERSIDLVDKLNKLDVSKDPDLIEIRKKLILQLDDAVTPKPLLPSIRGRPFGGSFVFLQNTLSDTGVWLRILASLAPWLFFSLFGLFGKGKNIAGVVGCLVLGFLFAGVGLLLPNVWWISYLAYPIGHFFLFLLFIFIVISNQKNKAAKVSAEPNATAPTTQSPTM